MTDQAMQRKAWRLVALLATYAPAPQIESVASILSAATRSGDALSFASGARVAMLPAHGLAEARALASEAVSGEHAPYWRKKLAGIMKTSAKDWLPTPRQASGI
jgi:hypothetical protein